MIFTYVLIACQGAPTILPVRNQTVPFFKNDLRGRGEVTCVLFYCYCIYELLSPPPVELLPAWNAGAAFISSLIIDDGVVAYSGSKHN